MTQYPRGAHAVIASALWASAEPERLKSVSGQGWRSSADSIYGVGGTLLLLVQNSVLGDRAKVEGVTTLIDF